ncbi:MAG: D-alanine--D-alanine ligase [Flavobacteriaceae bacterium]|nr:D-alanine--D-alanine ligase [Flavobacteriaceae bacterium]
MKKNIAIVMGGNSTEAAISIKSGTVVYQNLDKTKYAAYCVTITNNNWEVISNTKKYPIDKSDFSFNTNGFKIKFDCVFNAIHGSPGEDGLLTAYFDLLGIKHTSAPFYQMALTFNKKDCLSVLRNQGIKMATSYIINKGETVDTKAIVKKVGLPCFVKPNQAGSSFGISKVFKETDLPAAIDIAFAEDATVLIESFLEGTEVSVGVIEYKNDVLVLPPTEIVSENDFFDYDAKYNGRSQEITPARISAIQLENLKKVAKKIYEILQMSGFTRSEFIFIGDDPYFLELNTVPGFTNESLLPQQARAAGISLTDLFGSAIENALL